MPAPTHIAELIKNIPNKAGIYQYYDKKENLLYIGKAKNLKKAPAQVQCHVERWENVPLDLH